MLQWRLRKFKQLAQGYWQETRQVIRARNSTILAHVLSTCHFLSLYSLYIVDILYIILQSKILMYTLLSRSQEQLSSKIFFTSSRSVQIYSWCPQFCFMKHEKDDCMGGFEDRHFPSFVSALKAPWNAP